MITKGHDGKRFTMEEWNDLAQEVENYFQQSKRPSIQEQLELALEDDISDSYPDDNPKTAFGLSKLPLHLVPSSTMAALGRAFADGAAKYGPFNWREKKISSTVYYGAFMRHVTAWYDGEDYAEDSGVHHLDHAIACIAMIIDGESVGKLNDDRPPKGAMPKLIKEYSNEHPTNVVLS